MLLRTVVVLCLFVNGALSQEAQLTVINPSTLERQNEPVVIDWQVIAKVFPKAGLSAIRITDEEGRFYIYQVDDINQDGTPDELVFLADFAAKQSRTFRLREGAEQFQAGSHVVVSTDAQNWKPVDGVLQSLDDDDGPAESRAQTRYRFDGVGWESELIGYRVYLDDRNAVDIQAKRRPGLHWKFIGSTAVDYQQNSDWGMDPLHVGPALGVGGIAFWIGDSVHKPLTLERRRTRIINRGPVRAVVRVDYFGWDVGGEKMDVSSLFTINAGDRVSEHRVTLQKGTAKTLVTGIVKHDSSKVTWDAQHSLLASRGKQSRAGDELFLALQFSPKDVLNTTADQYNDLVLLRVEAGASLRFLISSVWEGESGTMWSTAKLEAFLQRAAARLNEPLVVSVK